MGLAEEGIKARAVWEDWNRRRKMLRKKKKIKKWDKYEGKPLPYLESKYSRALKGEY